MSTALPLQHTVALPPVTKSKWMLGAHWNLSKQADLDLSCLLFDAKGRFIEVTNFVSRSSTDAGLTHLGDSVSGLADSSTGAADELLRLDMQKLSPRVFSIVAVVSIFRGKLSMLRHLKMRLVEIMDHPKLDAAGRISASEVEIAASSFDCVADCNPHPHSAIAVWKMYRKEVTSNEWMLNSCCLPGEGGNTAHAIPLAQRTMRDVIPGIRIARTDGLRLDVVEDVCTYLTCDMITKVGAAMLRSRRRKRYAPLAAHYHSAAFHCCCG